MDVVPKTTSFRAPWFFLLCCGALGLILLLIPDDLVAQTLAVGGATLSLGQKVYLVVSLALCLTVFMFGTGPLSQHGRWAAPPGWVAPAGEGGEGSAKGGNGSSKGGESSDHQAARDGGADPPSTPTAGSPAAPADGAGPAAPEKEA